MKEHIRLEKFEYSNQLVIGEKFFFIPNIKKKEKLRLLIFLFPLMYTLQTSLGMSDFLWNYLRR